MARVRDPEGKRAALLAAGLRLAGRGLQGWSINAITAEAGVAKGTFYVHFAGRAEYLLALHHLFHERVLGGMGDAVGDQPPGRAALLAGALAYLDGCLNERAVKALLLEARIEPVIQAEIGARNEMVAVLTEPHFAAMGWREPRTCARLFIALVAEAALLELPGGVPDPAVRRAVAEFLDRTREG
ncbi:TetR family transcriptional regulator [Krasilnikovia cinnamomea]|uniref:TetR family transcriptional regulator n=1 Tax=Krasilnikovia cinnamomea TaxID=349313 RepID=A0A4Q7ZLA4_9ACTN|nr:TetR family transcriptional regulator [Krasilnikovia cinnamomea]RZU51738.1 TetR family transcriptional regulator [Krasilnikovia cinnamomea]